MKVKIRRISRFHQHWASKVIDFDFDSSLDGNNEMSRHLNGDKKDILSNISD